MMVYCNDGDIRQVDDEQVGKDGNMENNNNVVQQYITNEIVMHFPPKGLKDT